jgi:uncharacterized repeat protein (TIGR01451 family)
MTPARHARLGLRHRTLQVESLEPRRLLAIINWDGEANDNNWNTAANWDANAVPGTADDAVIGAAFASETITRDSGSVNLRSLTSDAALNFTGGSMIISGNSTINNALNLSGTVNLRLESMTLAGTGTLTNAALLRITNVTAISAGLATVAGSTIRIEGNSTTSSSTLTVASGFTNNGRVLLQADGSFTANLTVTSGTLVNAAGAVIQGTGTSPDHDDRIIHASVDNQGTIDATSSLRIRDAGQTLTNSGTLSVASGQRLQISTGTAVLNSGTAITGATDGLIDFAIFPGTHTIVLNTDLTLTDAMPNVSLGGDNDVIINGPGTLVNQTTLSLRNETINAPLDNQGSLFIEAANSINGAITTAPGSRIVLNGGSSGGTAALTVASGFTNNALIELRSNGTVPANLTVTTGTLTNATGATIQATGDSADADDRNLDAQITNEGLIEAISSLRIVNTSTTFTNSGTLTVSSGRLLRIDNGTTVINDGTTLSGDTDGAINFGAFPGIHTMNLNTDLTLTDPQPNVGLGGGNAVTINGPGTLINQAFLGLRSDTINAPLNNQGTLWAELNTAINGALTTAPSSSIHVRGLSGVGSATLTVANGFTNNGTIELLSNDQVPSNLAVTNGTLANSATGTINTSGDSSDDRELRAALDNQGIVNVTASMTINKSSADHVNNGTINLGDATLLVSQTGTTPTFTNSATIDIAPAGTLQVNGGAVSQVNPGTITGGGTFTLSSANFTGVGNIAASIANNGSLFGPGPGAGLLTIDGNYTQTSGTLHFEVGGLTPADDFDQVVVSGTANLAGTLRVDLIDSFVPNLGDSFLVLDGDTTGGFATLDLDPLPAGRNWQAATDPVIVSIVPDPTDISVTKTDSPDPVQSGVNLTYTITVRNTSSVDAETVSLSDAIPSGTTFVSLAAPAGWDTILPAVGSGGTVTATRARLAAGAVETFSLVVQVDAGLAAGTMITNVAQVATETNESNLNNNAASSETTVTIPTQNLPPVLTSIGDQSGNEGTVITFTAVASDPDQDSLAFSLDAGAPAGASIGATSGVFSWTPTEAQGTGTFQVTVRVTDDGDPALSDFETITISVAEVNLPPVLDAIADRNTAVGQTVTFTATASDPDLPANDLSFSLAAGAPAGATINATTGAFSWTPAAGDAGQMFDITVRGSDDGDPALSGIESFTIAVAALETNRPPVLDEIANQNTEVGQTVTFTATASDPDQDDLTFSLDAGAREGATIDPVTGAFSFTPSAAEAGETLSITVRVTDDGDPALSDTEAFKITIQPLVEPQFTLSAINGPDVGVPGQLRSYSVTFSDPDSRGSYTTTIDWGDGTETDGVMRTRSTNGVTTGVVSFWHTYTTIGDRTIRLTLRDGDGNELSADTFITVQLVTFQPDPLDPSKRALVAGGFNNVNDVITFNPQGSGINVMHFDYNHGSFMFDGSVMAFGQGGNDIIRVHQSLTTTALLFGQDGDDLLVGSAGSNILVGGAGNDTLYGYAARDLLFGGLGADMLFGLAPDETNRTDDGDLIASDPTAWEYDPNLLASIFHRWNSPDSYADRLHNLRYEQSPALNNTTVFDDFASDKLIGGSGLDWFVFLSIDWVMDREPGEEGLGVRL